MKLWKKVLAAVTAGVLCVGSVGVTGLQSVLESVGTVLSASAHDPASYGFYDSYDGTDGILYYKEYSDSVSIVGCKTNAVSIEIPEEIDGKNVTSIESTEGSGYYALSWFGAFEDCKSLTEITIPDSVTKIGRRAFCGCTSLAAITIPDSVTEIGEKAFYGCTSLTEITIPDSVTEIGGAVFSGCTSLTEITIPDSVTSLSGNIFYGFFSGCTSLTEITIPDSVTSIGMRAFEGCTSLTAITIPDSVTGIGEYAFYDCTNLKNVFISDLDSWCKIDFDAKSSNPLCMGANLYVNGALVSKITISDSVTRIGKYAFCDCTNLTAITLPDSVASIGYAAFSGCTNLKTITFLNPKTSIRGDEFGNCDVDMKFTTEDTYGQEGEVASVATNVTQLTVKHKEGKIPAGAYQGGKRLKEVTLEEGITLIEDDAFANCDNLEKIVIPRSVTGIRYTAFTYDTKLTMYGYKDTYAEKYAEMFGFPFVALDDSDTPPVTTTTTTETTTTTTTTTTTAATETTPPDTEPPATETTASTAQTLPAESTTTTTNTTAATETTTVTTAATTTTKPTPTLAKGDIDGSDNIDSTDIYYALYYVANIAVGNSGGLTREQIAAADVDGSGFVDSTDIYYMLYYVALHGAGIHKTWAEVLAK